MKINLKCETPPELVARLANDSIVLDSRITGKSDKEVIDIMISKEEHDVKSIGLMYHILTSGENPDLFGKMIRYVTGGGAEYWHHVLCNMNMILFEVWPFLHLLCKEQLLRLIREAVRQNVKQVENVLMNAFRMSIGSSDFATKQRIFMKLNSMIRENEAWFKSQKACAALVANILTCTTSVIISSPAPISSQDTFRESQLDLVQWVIKSRKIDCLTLGRDFILILIRLGKMPQIEEIWKDIVANPASFGVSNLEEYMTKQNVLQHVRISIELERKVQFMVVNGGKNLLTYFTWLNNKFFRANDGPALRAECVRYVLSMNLDPAKALPNAQENRVQLLHLLISTVPSGPELQWLKLCLFADWFGCDDKNSANLMCVENSFSVVRYALFLTPTGPQQNSIVQGSHCSQFANSLLEFLCKSVDVLLPPAYAEPIRRNVNSAMRFIKDRLQHNLPQILENSKIDRKVSELLRNVFPDFVRNPIGNSSIIRPKKKSTDEEKAIKSSSEPALSEQKSTEKPSFSTEKLSSDSATTKIEKEKLKKAIEEQEEQELNVLIKQLQGEIGTKIAKLKDQWKEFDDDADKCEAVEGLLVSLLTTGDVFDESQQELAAQCLLGIMGSVVADEQSLLPPNEKDLSEAFTHPIYSFLKVLCSPPDNDEASSDVMAAMMAAMREKDSSLTYVFLYFIKGTAGGRPTECIECYKNIAKMSGRSVDEMLASDLQLCAVNDNRLFAYLVPFVFSQFEEEVMSTPALLATLCANLDAIQLRSFVSEIIREEIKIFRKESFPKMVMDSVDWATTPQWVFWHLVHADGVPIEWFLSTIPKFDAVGHDEAIANILLMMKRMDREPWAGLIRALFNRVPNKDDTFTIDAMKVLIEDSEQCQKVAEIVAQLIKKLLGNNDIIGLGVRVHKKGNPMKLTLQQVLEHLQHFSSTCVEKKQRMTETFMSRSHLQEAFASIKVNDKAVVLVKKYGNLFGAMDIIAQDTKEHSSSRTLRGNRQGTSAERQQMQQMHHQKRKPNEDDEQNSKKRKMHNNIIELSDDSDSD